MWATGPIFCVQAVSQMGYFCDFLLFTPFLSKNKRTALWRNPLSAVYPV